MKLLIAGASGLIGTAVTARAEAQGHEVRALVRRPARGSAEYDWAPERGSIAPEAIEWADGVIALSGASVGKLPWTKKYRKEILTSRLETTGTLARAIAASSQPPSVWVNASAVGIYGDRPSEVLTEDSPRGTGFLADVCAQWEAATEPAAAVTRVVLARTGLVMAKTGALQPLRLATSLGGAARMGSGEQYWPWIDLDDEVAALLHLATQSNLSGPVNLAGPRPATSEDITRFVAQQLRRPHLFVAPAFVLKAVLGVAGEEMLLRDQDVKPAKLLADGFLFQHPTMESSVSKALRL